MPLTIRIDGTDYVDRRDLTPAAFWTKCATAADLPSTAAPATPGQFTAVYQGSAGDGADLVVVVCLSAAFLGHHAVCRLGAREFDRVPVSVIDGAHGVPGAVGMIVADCAVIANRASHGRWSPGQTS